MKNIKSATNIILYSYIRHELVEGIEGKGEAEKTIFLYAILVFLFYPIYNLTIIPLFV